MTGPPSPPIVAIVGRPNVGKSRLFNRYTGARRALVDDAPGLTRDRIAQEITLGDRRILLVDTAGLDPDAGEELGEAIQAQAQSAVDDADAILFVVDGKAGLLPEDQAIAATLRRSDRPLAVAVNKIDVPEHADRLADFYALGLAPMHAVSAEHGGGAFDALEELVAKLPKTLEHNELETSGGATSNELQTSGSETTSIAIVGRPNVGKSSLLNRLIGENRVVVSEVPGTTRDAIDVRVNVDGDDFVLVDTAGLRRQGRRTRTGERGGALMTVRALERANVALLVLDAEEGFSEQDARIASLVRERGCATAALANKWDRVSAEKADSIRADIEHGLRFMSDCSILRISAKTGMQLGRIFPLARKLARTGGQRIPTAELNRWLQEAVRRHEPSMARRGYSRRPIKFFYATQTGIRPPTFTLFCTEPEAIREPYRRFLENRMRETFDLEGTPIRLRLRVRSRKERD